MPYSACPLPPAQPCLMLDVPEPRSDVSSPAIGPRLLAFPACLGRLGRAGLPAPVESADDRKGIPRPPGLEEEEKPGQPQRPSLSAAAEGQQKYA